MIIIRSKFILCRVHYLYTSTIDIKRKRGIGNASIQINSVCDITPSSLRSVIEAIIDMFISDQTS